MASKHFVSVYVRFYGSLANAKNAQGIASLILPLIFVTKILSLHNMRNKTYIWRIIFRFHTFFSLMTTVPVLKLKLNKLNFLVTPRCILVRLPNNIGHCPPCRGSFCTSKLIKIMKQFFKGLPIFPVLRGLNPSFHFLLRGWVVPNNQVRWFIS